MTENIEQIKEEVPQIIEKAHGYIVSHPGEYTGAANYLKRIKFALKEVNEKIIAPAEEVKRKAEENRKNLVNLFRVPLQKAESIIKQKMLIFQREENRKATAEQARLQAIADAQAAREYQSKMKEAEKLKTPELKEQRLAEAAEIEAPIVMVQTETPTISGISTRKTWRAEVVDKIGFLKAAFEQQNLDAFIIIDIKALNRVAQATKGALNYPGIRFYEHETMAAGGR